MATATESMLTWVVAQLRGQGLTPYLDVAPQGATTWPLCVISIVGSSNQYSINNGAERIEQFLIRVSFFDRQDNKAELLAAMLSAELALENLGGVVVGGNRVMSTDKGSTLGPIWNGKEHYWQTHLGWSVYMSTSISGILNGKLAISGQVAIPVGATSVAVPAFGFAPGGVVVSVSKPTAGDDNIFATAEQDTITAGGCTVELSAAPTAAGYILNFVATQ